MVKDGGNSFDQLTEAGGRAQFSLTTPMTDVSRGVGTHKERLFELAVYCFSYDDNEMLHKVQDLMKKVNEAALPNTALRAHQLTEQQVVDAQNGVLDIICGFQVIDEDFHIIVIEGLGRWFGYVASRSTMYWCKWSINYHTVLSDPYKENIYHFTLI